MTLFDIFFKTFFFVVKDMGKCAMEERARNTVIQAKKDKLSYSRWLKQYVGEGDYDAEFGERCFRRNEKWHARWESYCENDEMTFEFTDKDTLEIDIASLNRHCDGDADDRKPGSGKASHTLMPPELKEWNDRGGNAILRLSPCPAASLITLVRERLVLHKYALITHLFISVFDNINLLSLFPF